MKFDSLFQDRAFLIVPEAGYEFAGFEANCGPAADRCCRRVVFGGKAIVFAANATTFSQENLADPRGTLGRLLVSMSEKEPLRLTVDQAAMVSIVTADQPEYGALIEGILYQRRPVSGTC